jgi:glucan phosphoethanolaminetransferase (alkaline phosphatase superfamily)
MNVRDLYTALASPANLWLTSVTFLSLASVPPIFIYGLLLWCVPAKYQTGGRGLTAVLLSFLLCNSLVFAWDEHYLNVTLGNLFFDRSPALSLTALSKTAVGAIWSKAEISRLNREQLTYHSPTPPPNNIVYIIDESLRGDHLSINGYPRQTTSYLESLQAQGLATSWGIASASATESIQSNRVLISGISQLPDPNFLHEQYPTLFQYAKAMGYTTYYFDTQTAHLWNALSFSDLNKVDHWLNTDTLGSMDMHSDFRAAERIQQITNQSVGNFIVLNKTGAHFHYNDKYPADRAIWTPVPPTGEYDNASLVTNTYDNAIHYNAEGFWKRLIPNPKEIGSTTYLYTADHGETLAENGEWWLHGGNSQQEARVPILLITQQSLSVDSAYQASHYNLFPTLLDLIAFPQSERPHSYPLSLLVARATDSTPRYFLGGNGQSVLFQAIATP